MQQNNKMAISSRDVSAFSGGSRPFISWRHGGKSKTPHPCQSDPIRRGSRSAPPPIKLLTIASSSPHRARARPSRPSRLRSLLRRCQGNSAEGFRFRRIVHLFTRGVHLRYEQTYARLGPKPPLRRVSRPWVATPCSPPSAYVTIPTSWAGAASAANTAWLSASSPDGVRG